MNRRTEYASFTARPVAGALGAEICNIDLSDELTDQQVADIRAALLDHLVIFFRDQRLSPLQQIRFAELFGSLEEHEFVRGLPEYPQIIRVVREADEATLNFGGAWHADVTHQQRPAMGSVLYAIDVPPYGGDTLFANQYLAFETLSSAMQQLLLKMRAVHTARGPFGPQGRSRTNWKNMQVEVSEKALQEVVHPVVRTHPETGRRGLFVNRTFTVRFEGMTEDESRPLLEFLFQHACREELTCRFRWQQGSVAFWDNRCVLHYALNDYPGFRREMHRVAVSGDRPV